MEQNNHCLRKIKICRYPAHNPLTIMTPGPSVLGPSDTYNICHIIGSKWLKAAKFNCAECTIVNSLLTRAWRKADTTNMAVKMKTIMCHHVSQCLAVSQNTQYYSYFIEPWLYRAINYRLMYWQAYTAQLWLCKMPTVSFISHYRRKT